MKLFIFLLSLCAVNVMAAPVNVNTADAKTIAEALTGVGPAKAEAIIEYREKNGPFKSAEDFIKVPGIGEKTVEKNKNDILFEGGSPATQAPETQKAKK
jgi:competence protein ComEA